MATFDCNLKSLWKWQLIQSDSEWSNLPWQISKSDCHFSANWFNCSPAKGEIIIQNNNYNYIMSILIVTWTHWESKNWFGVISKHTLSQSRDVALDRCMEFFPSTDTSEYNKMLTNALKYLLHSFIFFVDENMAKFWYFATKTLYLRRNFLLNLSNWKRALLLLLLHADHGLWLAGKTNLTLGTR